MSGLTQLSPLWIISLVSFISLMMKVLNDNKEIDKSKLIGLHALGILSSLLLLFILGFNEAEALSLKFDAYGSLACAVLALAGLQTLFLFSFNSWIDKRQLTEILFLFSHGLLALYVLCLAQDLMTAFIGLELASLIVYINLAMSRKDHLCLESSMKYFILSALSGVVFLYGLSFLFAGVGSLEFRDFFLSETTSYNRFFFLGFALIFTALFFKVALFPFQFWLADVYQGTNTAMTAFMATVMKSAVVLFIGRLFSFPFFEKGEHGFILISGLAIASVLTLLFGNIMALGQNKIKRMIAFSSVAHSGYMMMALAGILSVSSEEKNLAPIVYYILSYIFMTGGLLTVVQSLETNGKSSQLDLQDLKSLFKSHPLLATCASLFLIGLAGLPPTFGFFAKLALFQPLVLSGSWWVLFWAFVGSAIGLYYYIKPIVIMISGDDVRSIKLGATSKFLLAFTSFGTLCGAFGFGFFF